jgi:hypothetical protein
MMQEFTIEFEVKSRRSGKFGDPEKVLVEYNGNLENGLKLLDNIKKKIGVG